MEKGILEIFYFMGEAQAGDTWKKEFWEFSTSLTMRKREIHGKGILEIPYFIGEAASGRYMEKGFWKFPISLAKRKR